MRVIGSVGELHAVAVAHLQELVDGLLGVAGLRHEHRAHVAAAHLGEHLRHARHVLVGHLTRLLNTFTMKQLLIRVHIPCSQLYACAIHKITAFAK